MGQWISKKTRLQLVADWRNAWRWISTHCMLVAIAIQAGWQELPAELQAAVPEQWVTWGTVAVLALGLVGRVVKQASLHQQDHADGQDGGEVGQ